MSVKALIADFRSSMVRIDYVVEEIDDAGEAKTMFRLLNKACSRLVPKYQAGHTLFTRIVPDAQMTLWTDFARRNGEGKELPKL